MGIVYGVIVGKRHDSRTATWGMFGFLEVIVAKALAVLKIIELIKKVSRCEDEDSLRCKKP